MFSMYKISGNPRGIYTTEFWITMFGILINFLNIINVWNFMSNWHSGVLMTIFAAAYKLSRGLSKSSLPVPNVRVTNR